MCRLIIRMNQRLWNQMSVIIVSFYKSINNLISADCHIINKGSNNWKFNQEFEHIFSTSGCFVNNYYYKGHLVPQKLIHTYYQSAHIGDGGGKYLLASIKSYYTNINIVSAIKKINNSICLIGGKEHPYIEEMCIRDRSGTEL